MNEPNGAMPKTQNIIERSQGAFICRKPELKEEIEFFLSLARSLQGMNYLLGLDGNYIFPIKGLYLSPLHFAESKGCSVDCFFDFISFCFCISDP